MALSIGQLAQETGVGRETVRFYERQGLIQDPPRTDSGYRLYPATAVQRLRFIKRAKELGFSLREIAELLSLRVDPVTTCADVRRLGEERMNDIEERIQDLTKMKSALARLLASCTGRGPTSACPLLEALAKEDAV